MKDAYGRTLGNIQMLTRGLRRPCIENAQAKQKPIISIVMPSFNQGRFIERSILSVLNQDYPHVELIVIDGGSKDETLEVLNRYSSHIAFWRSQPDQGQSDALNVGFALAKGEILGWLNSDDLYLPNAFSLAASTLAESKSKNIVFGDWLSIDENDCVLDFNHAFDFSLSHFVYEGFHLNSQAMFWRRGVHQGFSGFQTDLFYTMDYQMILEFGKRNGNDSFKRISHPLAAFRRYHGQKTGTMSPEVQAEHRLLAHRYQYSDKYRWQGSLKRLLFRIRRANWYARRGGPLNLFRRVTEAISKRLHITRSRCR